MSPECHNKLKTHQELHDTIIAHFLTMPKPAVNGGIACKYRSDTGGKCFAGALIPDDMYSTNMEQTTAAGNMVGSVLRDLGWEAPMVREYQRIHDDATNEVICKVHNRDVNELRTEVNGSWVNPEYSWPEEWTAGEEALADWRKSIAERLVKHGNKYGLNTPDYIQHMAGA